ncbi:MAG TPA: glycoside hydrolase domain-containing protein [Gemmatimonadales bacterium]|nr:glycoside hydrolase domain-containing protein [Gemmatimonadales bacterium]
MMLTLPTALLAALTVTHVDTTAYATPLYRAPAISNVIDGVRYEPGNWEPMLAAGAKGESWGNHRAVVTLEHRTTDPVVVTVPWRRHDEHPERKAIVVVDARTGKAVNSLPLHVDNVSGEIVFAPVMGHPTYFVYYLPWVSTGGYYPKVTYPSSMTPSDSTWVRRARALDPATLARARTTAIQSVNAFHSFFPMEVIATPDETARFHRAAGGDWALVAEHRDFPIRMQAYIPVEWATRTTPAVLSSRALRGESFTFQVGVVAGTTPLDSLDVRFEGFPARVARALTCFNCGGIDENGQPFTKVVSVPAGQVQALWIGWMVPNDMPSGPVSGRVVVQPRGGVARHVRITIDVQPEQAVNHGYDEPDLLTRLAWLNSTAGSDTSLVIAPFSPVSVRARTLGVLGRRVLLGASGFPTQIQSDFTATGVIERGRAAPVLAAPVDLQVIVGGVAEPLLNSRYTVGQPARSAATWAVDRRSDRVAMHVDGRLEYDGMLAYRVKLTALRDLDVDDIRLPVTLQPAAATYMLGLGHKGGLRPDTVNWKWDVTHHQEGVWLGGVDRGLQYVLRDDGYVRPLNTNFYQNQPLRLPAAWVNGGKGGITIDSAAGVVRVLNYSGARHLAAGDTLQFDVRFLLTPFKPIDTGTHFRTRFVHKYVPVDSVRAWGGTVVNIHHANAINPYINYPFFNLEAQQAYIAEAHAKGIKVKLYDTIRELTYHAYELFALRSLGDEIFNDGEGGGHSWLQEHLGSHYHSAWHAYGVDDAAILDKGTSRWTNYYVEGLSWLASHQQIDGLYLDDIAFSRATVKRIVAVLQAERPEVVIDLHSANQFNPNDGFTNSAMLYMETFPYISRLWFGEYFDYNAPPAYWMTEVSGLPYGLMGEMLQDGGQPWRGLVYGMTARLYGDVDPRPVWQMMDAFGIDQSRMMGYWLPTPPVTTGNDAVRATAYVRDNRILVAIGSWSDQDETIALRLDPVLTKGWGAMRATAPAVAGLQPGGAVDLSRVVVPAKQGLFVVIEK